MTAALMMFLFLVSCLAGLAAWLAERGLRGLGLPSRLVWLGGLAAGPVLLAAAILAPSGTGVPASELLPAGVFELPALVVGDGGAGGGVLDRVLLALWLASALGVIGFLGVSYRRLGRTARGWRNTRVLGRVVAVSDGLGPAVTGILRGRIVVPEWTLALPEPHLRLVLAHEEEHRRAADPGVLALAVVLVAVTAWNPVSWGLLRRLRDAIEIDCDRRVLRKAESRRAYGESLLAVAARASRPALPIAAFTEPPRTLERRLIAMTSRISNRSRLLGGVLVAVAIVVGAQACGVDNPVGPDAAQDIEPRLTVEARDVSESPTFTPFTVAPEILNRREIIEAMEAEYPPLLRDAGIGGTVRVYFFITNTGEVGDVRLDQSSGHEALDLAALRVADLYRFAPALNRDQRVPAWVSFPITFQAGG